MKPMIFVEATKSEARKRLSLNIIEETNADSDPDCLLLMGEAGAGKTTIYKTYAQNYPRQETDEGSIVPIVYTPIPVPATVSSYGR
jgi:ABC-type multidrug transport system ATPase subunit